MRRRQREKRQSGFCFSFIGQVQPLNAKGVLIKTNISPRQSLGVRFFRSMYADFVLKKSNTLQQTRQKQLFSVLVRWRVSYSLPFTARLIMNARK